MKTNSNVSPNSSGVFSPTATATAAKPQQQFKRCSVPGCPTRGEVDETGTCSAHGAKRKRCKIEGCPNGMFMRATCCNNKYALSIIASCDMCTCRRLSSKSKHPLNTHLILFSSVSSSHTQVSSKEEFASSTGLSAAFANIRAAKRTPRATGCAANTDLLARGVTSPSAPTWLSELESASLMGRMPQNVPL